jgi:hypothetical protein
LLVANPHADGVTRVQVSAPLVVDVTPQHAPTGQLVATQVVPTPLNVWLAVVPQPVMVLMEHEPAVEQQAPTRDAHGPGQGTPSP